MNFKQIITTPAPSKNEDAEIKNETSRKKYRPAQTRFAGLPYASRMITLEDSPGYGPYTHPTDWIEEHGADVNAHFMTLTRILRKHFPDKSFDEKKMYRHFQRLAFTYSSSSA